MVDLTLGGKEHSYHGVETPLKTKKSTRESLDPDLAGGESDVPACPTCQCDDPVKRLDQVQRMGSVLVHEMEDAPKDKTETGETATQNDNSSPPGKTEVEIVDEENVKTDSEAVEAQRLHKMGLNTAIAIGLHNFPEGNCE